MTRSRNIIGYSALLIGVVALSCWLYSRPVLAEVGSGDKIQAFSLEKRGEGSFTYPQDTEGKVVFINFWAAWCAECKIELPELDTIRNKYKDQPFILLAVNIDRKQKTADRFLRKVQLDLLVLYDQGQKLVKQFAPVGVPASYLIRPDGRVEKVYLGFKMDYIAKYISDIDQLLKTASPNITLSPETAQSEPQTGATTEAGNE